MELLLTSGGIRNQSIHDALVELLGKPIAESSALCIPTATHAIPGGAAHAWRLVNGQGRSPLCELSWGSLGVLELTALPSISPERWLPAIRETDALLVGGGDCLYLCYWLRRSGLADLFPSLPSRMVYVGVSAGSMALTSIGFRILREDFGGTIVGEAEDGRVPPGNEGALGLVDFSLLPHLDGDNPENSLANFEIVAATTSVPAYAIDDETAIKVSDGVVDVVSEGHWKLLNA